MSVKQNFPSVPKLESTPKPSTLVMTDFLALFNNYYFPVSDTLTRSNCEQQRTIMNINKVMTVSE